MERLTLSETSQQIAIDAARGRYSRRRASNSQHKWNRADDHTQTIELDSIGAEIFAAEQLALPWIDQHAPDSDGDLGHGYQVRQTPHQNGHLTVHKPEEGDHPGHIFILVIGRFPTYRIPGWMYGHEAQNPNYLKNFSKDPNRPRPAYQVPQHKLHPPWKPQ